MNGEKEVKEEQENKKLTLKERWKDRRERAKIKLCLYGIFFLIVIIFTRVQVHNYEKLPQDNKIDSFINTINDNYIYTIEVTINNNKYLYSGKKLGHNSSITRTVEDTTEYYYEMNNKYYILDNNGNYILTSEKEIYPYIDYRYLDLDNIKEYIKLGTKENNIYKVKLSDITLNNSSNNYITISIDEDNKVLLIDYTELFKIDDSSINTASVKINYRDIGKVISLEE